MQRLPYKSTLLKEPSLEFGTDHERFQGRHER